MKAAKPPPPPKESSEESSEDSSEDEVPKVQKTNGKAPARLVYILCIMHCLIYVTG